MPGKSRKIVKWIVIAFVIIIGIALVAGAFYWNRMLNLLGDADQTVPTLSQEEEAAILGTMEITEEITEETEPAPSTEPEETLPALVSGNHIYNIMLVGQNWREDEQNKLSDTMILCSINRQTKTITFVSFLRDLYVPLPAYAGHGTGRNRMNVCYALGSSWKGTSKGGMEMLALCVEQNFGIHIDHTIEVSLDSFPRIIDGFGGVEIDVTEEEAKYMTEKVGYVGDVQPGLQTLDGMETLAYSRIRQIDNDRQRSARQRTVLAALVNKCRDLSIVDFLTAAEYVLPSVTTDMTNEDITSYIWELAPVLRNMEIRSLTCPADNDTLPNSMWGKTIDLYGYMSSVVECNTSLNGKYLREELGIAEKIS